MRRFLYLLAATAVLAATSCKTYNYDDFKQSPTDFSYSKPVKLIIDDEEIKQNYVSSVLYVNTGQLVTNDRKDQVEQTIKNIKTHFEPFKKNGTSDSYGYMRITMDKYYFRAAGVGYALLNGFFLFTPMLFGSPMGAFVSEVRMIAEVYDNNKVLIKEYKIDGKGKAHYAGYGCYKTKEIEFVTNMRAVNDALEELKLKMLADKPTVNAKLEEGSPITSEFIGRFIKDPDEITDGGDVVKSGTGFVLSELGYVATNFHVINESSQVELMFNINNEVKKYKAKVVTADQTNDIAVLKIEDDSFIGFDKLPYTISDEYEVGGRVFTIGYPSPDVMGTAYKFTSGEVNSLSGIENNPTMMQISVPIQPGNSGGPLFNEKGDVVGITTSTLNPFYMAKYGQSVPQNVNYAVKSDYLKALAKQYLDKSENKIADLGTNEKVTKLSAFTCLVKIY